MNKPTYHTTLPPHVRFDQKLPANAKLLYAEIKALCDQQGYCWASNYYFATLYGVKKETISLWLSHLRERKFIRVRNDEKQGNQRQIYLHDQQDQGYEKSEPAAGKNGRGLPSSSLLPSELIVPNEPSLLIQKNIDYNDRIHSDPLTNSSKEESVGEEETKGQKDELLVPNPPVALPPLPPAKKNAPPPFVKPSVKEAEDYMLSQEELCPNALTARAQALRFVNYYESNGWRVGRNAMKDWRAAANNWLLNAQTYQPTKPGTQDRLHSGGIKDYSVPL